MKKSKICCLAVVGLLAACDPIIQTNKIDDSIVSAENLDLEIMVKQVDGKNSNVFTVENHSAILAQWTVKQLLSGETLSSKSADELYVSTIGTHEIHFKGLNYGSGLYVEKALTIQVDTIAFVPSDISERLCMGEAGAPTHFGVIIEDDKFVVRQEVTKSGEKGNRLFVENANPVLTTWQFGSSKLERNIGEIVVKDLGEYELKVALVRADGQKSEKSLGKYLVETILDK